MIWSADLQRAVYERLFGQLVAGVYNAVPEPARAPYVVIGGETTEFPGAFETMTSDGSEETFYVHAWDNAKGQIRLKRIMADIDRLLHDEWLWFGDALCLRGKAYLYREFKTTLDEQQDDRAFYWRHGVLRYRCLISAIEPRPAPGSDQLSAGAGIVLEGCGTPIGAGAGIEITGDSFPPMTAGPGARVTVS